MKSVKIKSVALLVICFLLRIPSVAGTLILSSDFVNRVKNTATISVHLELDAHLKTPHRIAKGGDDGDIHMAGRADEVQLPLVAEIVNARNEPGSLKLLNGTPAGNTVDVTGVWRIWFEHPGKADMIQGAPVDVPGDSNPDHVFEIHPITLFGNNNVLDSFVPIANRNSSYQAYPAATAFASYENQDSTIQISDTSVSITAKQAGYNYTEFVMELAGDPQASNDGFFVLANVFDTSDQENPVVADVRRMVFVKGTDPANQLLNLGKGDRLHVLGIPRVNLSEVAAVPPGDPVRMNLPYEMIIVAVLPD
jgi:hypothetical protein